MRPSPIHEIHKSLGAAFCKVMGREMPAHYRNPVAEHLNVRKGAGIADLTYRGKICISGKDRTAFLQKILSQDMNKFTPNIGAYSTLLDVKGKMLAYMRIYCDEGTYLIDVEPGQSENLLQILTRYLFREDVRIEDVTEQYGLITIQGPLSGKLLAKVTRTEWRDMTECSHIHFTINTVNCRIVRTSYIGEEGYDIYSLQDGTPVVWEAFFAAGIEYGIRPFGLYALETLRIEAGTPVYYIDMDEHTLPVEANLDKAISYDKGCYIGQETIARIKFRGHVNRTLTGFIFNEDIIPMKGDKIYNISDNSEHNIGVITSSCFSPTLNKVIALGYIRLENNKPGEAVCIIKDSHILIATVTKLPFYQPQKPDISKLV